MNKPNRIIIILFLSFCMLFKNSGIVECAVFHVPKDFHDIQTALNKAQKGDIINVAAGVYRENIIWPETPDIQLIGRQKDTIIDGAYQSHVIVFQMKSTSTIGNQTLISGFKLQNGKAPKNFPYGGGIFIKNASPTIRHVIIMENYADKGGGLYCDTSHIKLDHSIISVNKAINAGAIYCHNAKPLFIHNIITHNKAIQGAGLSFFYSDAQLISSTLMDNKTTSHTNITSSIFVYNTTLDIQQSILWNTKSHHEIYCSDFSDKNKIIIAYSNIQKGQKSIHLHDQDELIWHKSNTIKPPKPFGLHMKTNVQNASSVHISNTNSVTINGQGGIPNAIEILANGEKISGITRNVFNDTFSIQIPLPDGTHTITAQYPDENSDTPLESDPIIITVDTIPPSIMGIQNDPYPKALKSWQWKAKDADTNIQYRYLIDQQLESVPTGSYTQTFSATIMPPDYHDGKWYLHIQAIDTALNESSVTTVYAILDATLPVMSGLANQLTPVQQINWNWNAEEQISGTQYRYIIDQNLHSTPIGDFSGKNSVQFYGNDGKWYIHVQAKDLAGNLSEVVTVAAIIDKTAPVIAGLIDDPFPQKNKTWEWSAKDSDPQINYRYSISQDSHAVFTGVFSPTRKAILSQSNGKWYLHVQAKDRAGNLSETVTVSAILDNIPPVINGLLDDSVPVKQKKWLWTINDSDPQVKSRFTINQQASFKPVNDFKDIHTAEIDAADGKWYLHVQAIDRAGNLSSIVSVFTFLDNTPPVIAGLNNHHIPSKTIHWNWEGLDTDTNIVFRYDINQSPDHQFSIQDQYTNSQSATISNKDGKWYLHVQARDTAQNISDIVTISAILDNTPPIIKGIISDNKRVKEKRWSWNADDIDRHIVYRYVIDDISDTLPGGAYTDTTAVLLNQLNGTYYIHLQAKDQAGNESKVVHAKTIVDIIPPVITGLVDDSTPCHSKTWRWGVNDLDPFCLFRFSMNTEKQSVIGGPFIAVTQTTLDQEDGLHYLHVQAKDSAGNVSKIETVSVLLDNTPPVINGLSYDHIPRQSVLWKWQTIDTDPEVLCRFNVNQQAIPETFGTFQQQQQFSLADKNGRWFIHVQAKDTAGNLSEITTGSAILDNLPPTILGLEDDPTRIQQKKWQWHADDADTIIHYRFIVHQTRQSNISGIFQNISRAVINDSNGIWYLNVQAKDRAGNLSAVVSVSTILDVVPPLIKGLSNDFEPKTQKVWSWYADDDDSFVVFRYTINQQKNSVPTGRFESKTTAKLEGTDGQWFLHVQGKDRAGNISETISVSTILDNTPPEIINISDDYVPKQTHQWSWHAKDADAQLLYRFSVDSDSSSPLATSYTETATTSISNVNGVWYLNIQAKDRAGNCSVPVSVKAILDNTPPKIINLSNDPEPQQMKKWQWQADDQDPHILYRYTIDQHSESSPTGTFTHTSHASIENVNGKWYLHVQAKDRSGNLSSVTTVSVILDSTAPVITGLSNDPIPVQAKQWMWSASDNDSSIKFRYVINQIAQVQLKNSYSTVTKAQINDCNGKWYLHVQAKDSAGNESETISVSAVLDNIPPVIQGLVDEPLPLKQKTWIWDIKDDDTDVMFRHQVTQNQQPNFSTSFSKTGSVSISNKNGKWYLHVQAKDRAGNLSDPVSVSVFLDNNPPVIQGLVNDNLPKKRKQWQWQSKDDDPHIQYRYVIDQIKNSRPTINFEPVNTAQKLNGDGLWYLHVQAKDRAGNLSDVVSVSAILDNTPPLISGLENDDIPSPSKQWTWTLEDYDPDVLCRYSVDQNTFLVSTTSFFQKETTVEVSGLEGKFYLHVQAKDRANNISPVISVYTILDQKPPIITGLVDDFIPKKIKQWQWDAIDLDPAILYRYRIDQNANASLTGSFSDVTTAELNNPDGKWYIHVQAKDRAGHLSNIVSVSTIIDNTAPGIRGIENDPIPCLSKRWQWYADDADADIKFRHIISHMENAQLTGEFTKEKQAILNQDDGKFYIQVQAKDRAGNISDIVTVSTIIDKTAPAIKGLSDEITPTKQKKWCWEAIDADPEVSFRYLIDQTPHTSLSGVFIKQTSASLHNENGTFYIHVQGRDRAGNISGIVDAFVVLDNIPPKIIGLFDDIIPIKKKKWEWNADDVDSDIMFRYTINQSEQCQLNQPFTYAKQSEFIHQNGKWFIHVQAKDRAGNLSDIQTASTIIDNQSKGLYINLHIHFDSNQAYTEILFVDAVKRIAKLLKRHPDTMAIIEAHCDNQGDEELNQNLSERRAQNVRSILIKKYKISETRLQAIGYGATKPIADNSTEEGRRKNRRADVYIYHTYE